MTETVSVACKLPNGLILRVFDYVDIDVPVLGGGGKKSKERRAVQKGEPVTVYGPATPFGQQPKTLVVGGYAITSGINAEFFQKWLEQNADLEAVKAGLIFAHTSADSARDQAKDGKDIKSGLEPLMPDKDERNPRSINPNLSELKTANKEAA